MWVVVMVISVSLFLLWVLSCYACCVRLWRMLYDCVGVRICAVFASLAAVRDLLISALCCRIVCELMV